MNLQTTCTSRRTTLRCAWIWIAIIRITQLWILICLSRNNQDHPIKSWIVIGGTRQLSDRTVTRIKFASQKQCRETFDKLHLSSVRSLNQWKLVEIKAACSLRLSHWETQPAQDKTESIITRTLEEICQGHPYLALIRWDHRSRIDRMSTRRNKPIIQWTNPPLHTLSPPQPINYQNIVDLVSDWALLRVLRIA